MTEKKTEGFSSFENGNYGIKEARVQPVRTVTDTGTIKTDGFHILKFVEESIIGTPLYGWILTTRSGKIVESLYYTTKPAALSNCVNVLAMSLLDPALKIEDENENTQRLLLSAVRRRFQVEVPDWTSRGHGEFGDII